MRRILGVFVMLAGLLGLLLSLAGLVFVWVAKPTVEVYAASTIDTLDESIVTSKGLMGSTSQALGGTIDSVDALSAMLATTAATVEDTTPVVSEIDTMMATTLPSTLQATTDSLSTAQDAARVLESTIQSLEAFRFLLSADPLLGGILGAQAAEPYNPEKPLADSLGEMAANLEDLPDTFSKMSESLSTTDDKLADIQGNLITMSDSVKVISSSLSDYERMVGESQTSMDNLASMLANIKANLPRILYWAAIVLTLFFAWLLAAQIVIFSQGWELYHGTADRLDNKAE